MFLVDVVCPVVVEVCVADQGAEFEDGFGAVKAPAGAAAVARRMLRRVGLGGLTDGPATASPEGVSNMRNFLSWTVVWLRS